MSYLTFLIAFSTAGFVLLVVLFADDSMEENLSAAELEQMKKDLESLKNSGDPARPPWSEKRGEEIAMATRRAMRRLAEDPERERRREEEAGLKPESRDAVIRDLRNAFVPKDMERKRFPLRAYMRADEETKRSLRLALIVLRTVRVAAKAGVHIR
jgi:hypothetical protein